MNHPSVLELLKENEKELLQERRAANRKPFVRHVTILAGKDRDPVAAFSRDLSPLGIGLISQISWAEQTTATLQIDTIKGRPVEMRATVRWTRPYGKDWYLSGWHFLDEWA